MKKIILLSAFLLSSASIAHDQYFKVANGTVVIPESSQEKAGSLGKHTNYMIYYPKGRPQFASSPLPTGETPASIACIYGFTPKIEGCPIASTVLVPTGGWGTIALVDAYHNPTAESDLQVFSSAFNLPSCTVANGCFTQTHPGNKVPDYNHGWTMEESLDVQWAHAMAPNAKIILVEAQSSSTADLLAAEDLATQLVQQNGGGLISNSWGGPEQPSDPSENSHFLGTGVVYLASAGDSAAPAKYPSSSPNVISAGGTSLVRKQGMFVDETAWNLKIKSDGQSGGSGGPSQYQSRPSYQDSVARVVGGRRGTPDIAFDADPETGVDVYSSDHNGWNIIGGTSVASPALAGVINSANGRATSTANELIQIYGRAQKNLTTYWHDIVSGYNGYYAMQGYDFTTGLGSPQGYLGM